MLVDGETEYACTARHKQGVTTLEPLPGKTLIRDLVTDVSFNYEVNRRIGQYNAGY